MNKQEKFILTPISSVLNDAVLASSGLGYGISVFPVSDYIMQSVFLRMTGFQEQKMKMIAWEMATDDLDFRRSLLYDLKLGEYSDLKSKNIIFSKLIEGIDKHSGSYIIDESQKELVISDTLNEIESIFNKTNLSVFSKRSFEYFLQNKNNVLRKNQFCFQTQGKYKLFESQLVERYEYLYTHRNRVAHNAFSYQHNLQTFSEMKSTDEYAQNYFIWFSILVLIDKIFIILFVRFKDSITSHPGYYM